MIRFSTVLVLITVVAVLLLAGCSGAVAPTAADLQPPSARLMTPPKPLPDVPKGADLYQENAQCTAAYTTETARLRSLQGWSRTVLKKN